VFDIARLVHNHNNGATRWGKNRLEAFSDGVIAITVIMVLELKVPHGATFDALLPMLPVLGSYVLSFNYVGIYWNKHQYGGTHIPSGEATSLFARVRLLETNSKSA
jgi:uncharacterized membrane protein